MRQVQLALWGVVVLTASAWLLVMSRAGTLALSR
jgi:hypothetical protein